MATEPQEHANTILGLPMALALPGLAALVVGFVFGVGYLSGAFDAPPQQLPPPEGLKGSSPFKIVDGDAAEDEGSDADGAEDEAAE